MGTYDNRGERLIRREYCLSSRTEALVSLKLLQLFLGIFITFIVFTVLSVQFREGVDSRGWTGLGVCTVRDDVGSRDAGDSLREEAESDDFGCGFVELMDGQGDVKDIVSSL